jgi:hypothetical protein
MFLKGETEASDNVATVRLRSGTGGSVSIMLQISRTTAEREDPSHAVASFQQASATATASLIASAIVASRAQATAASRKPCSHR